MRVGKYRREKSSSCAIELISSLLELFSKGRRRYLAMLSSARRRYHADYTYTLHTKHTHTHTHTHVHIHAVSDCVALPPLGAAITTAQGGQASSRESIMRIEFYREFKSQSSNKKISRHTEKRVRRICAFARRHITLIRNPLIVINTRNIRQDCPLPA